MRISLFKGAMRSRSIASAHAINGVEPVAVWNFATGEFPQGFSHARSTIAMGINADGTFAEIGPNMLRYDRSTPNPEVILEASSTNILSFSEAAVGAGWSPSGASASNLALGALGQFAGCRVASNGATWHRLLHAQRPILSSGVPYRVTCWLQHGTSGQAVIILRDNIGGTESRLLATAEATTVQAVSAGEISETSAITVDGTVVLSFVFTPNFSRDLNFGIGPASSTAGEDVTVLGAQVTVGTDSSSYIPSFGGAATRAADIVNWAAPLGQYDLRLTQGDGAVVDQTNVTVASNWGPKFPLHASKLALFPVGTL